MRRNVTANETEKENLYRGLCTRRIYEVLHCSGFVQIDERIRVRQNKRNRHSGKGRRGKGDVLSDFKRKEDVIIFYFEHNTKEFVFGQHFYPRCREDYLMVAKNVFKLFKQNKEPFKLLRKARLEHIYLDFLNKGFAEMFSDNHPDLNKYTPFLYGHAVQRVYALAGRRLRRRY